MTYDVDNLKNLKFKNLKIVAVEILPIGYPVFIFEYKDVKISIVILSFMKEEFDLLNRKAIIDKLKKNGRNDIEIDSFFLTVHEDISKTLFKKY